MSHDIRHDSFAETRQKKTFRTVSFYACKRLRWGDVLSCLCLVQKMDKNALRVYVDHIVEGTLRGANPKEPMQ